MSVKLVHNCVRTSCNTDDYIRITIEKYKDNGLRSPGLVVMGGDSCSKGREFESWHHILDGHFSHTYLL